MSTASGANGILVVDKPEGMTSHDVVDRVRRIFRTKRVGHTGTLDPDATGVLVLCLGQATRLAEYLSASAKHYRAEFAFGARTDTMDGSGAVIETRDTSALTQQDILEILPRYRGKILQTPPMVSARHHEGRRLYELAREGITVEREPRPIDIMALDLLSFVPGPLASASLEITCSTGTYIRVLAEDIGRDAGTGAYMKTLRRTWVGADSACALTLADAHSLDDLQRTADSGAADSALIPLANALRSMPQLRLTEEGLRRLRHGQSVPRCDSAVDVGSDAPADCLAAVLDDLGEVCAIVQCGVDSLRPVKVLAAS